jgi:thiol-disulfide isomerase/thioredoxin
VVKHVQSQEELETYLQEKSSANENPVIVLQCGYSYCRPCIKFEHSYESVAKDPRFKNIKFLKVVGDSSPALSHLTHELEVENTPDFRIFRGDKMVQKFTGANRKKLEDNLIAVLESKDVNQIPGIIIK